MLIHECTSVHSSFVAIDDIQSPKASLMTPPQELTHPQPDLGVSHQPAPGYCRSTPLASIELALLLSPVSSSPIATITPRYLFSECCSAITTGRAFKLHAYIDYRIPTGYYERASDLLSGRASLEKGQHSCSSDLRPEAHSNLSLPTLIQALSSPT